MNKPMLGIDLGTTNSLVAVIKESKQVEVLTNDRGDKLTPSVVKFDPDEVVVGKPALNSAIAKPNRVVQEVKRHMGEEWEFQPAEGDTYKPEEVSAYILEKLKGEAEKRMGREASSAVISHPARFGSVEREATKNAADIAGFKTVDLISEPEAAALSELTAGEELQGKVMIADIGGGTSDVSLLEVSYPDIKTETIEGDLNLGGTDLTARLVEEIEEEVGELEKPELRQEAFKRAEEAKIDLSNQKEVSFSLPTPDGLRSFRFTRDEYEELIRPKVEDMLGVCEDVLSNIGCEWKDVDAFLLVGGATRTPLIRDLSAAESGLEPQISSQPDRAIAVGSAVKAASLQGMDILSDTGEYILHPFHKTVLSKPIGVKALEEESGEDINKIILEKDSPLPVEGTEIFTTERDRQSNVGITLLEGRSRDPNNCTVLGEEKGHVLEGIAPKPAGVPRIELTLKVDEEGLLTGKALDLDSGTPLEFRQKIPELLSGKEKEKSKERVNNKTSK